MKWKQSGENGRKRLSADDGVRRGKASSSFFSTNQRGPEILRQQRREMKELKAELGSREWSPGSWPSIGLGFLLLPLAGLMTATFFAAAASAMVERGLWRSAPVWFFALGALLWAGLFWSGMRGRIVYVLGHELTHALFVWASGGTVVDIQFSKKGGQVLTDKNNLLISLSPYLVPFWSLVVMGLYWLGCLCTDLSQTHVGFFFGVADFRWEWLLYCLLGLTWAMHLTYTVWMTSKDQPDLWHYGPFFSMVFIYIVNLVLITSLFVAASPDLTWRGYLETLLGAVQRWGRLVGI